MKRSDIGILAYTLLGIIALSLGGLVFWLLNAPSDFAFYGGIFLAVLIVLAAIAAARKINSRFFVAALALLILGACTRIDPGHVGIVVNMAGGNRGVENLPTSTGWTFYNPFGTTVYKYPTFVQTAKWTKSPDEGKPQNEEITFTNRDSMLIAADVSLSYSLIPDKVPAFYVKFRSDDLDGFTHGYLRNVARDAFNETAGHFSIEQIMGDNGPFLAQVRERLQKETGTFGVRIEQFGFIGAPRPPDSVVAAINLKVQALQTAQQKQNEIVQAQAEAQKTVATAEGAARAQVARAEGEAKANQLLAQSISPALIQWRQLEIQQQAVIKWNGSRPQVEGGSAGLLLQIAPK